MGVFCGEVALFFLLLSLLSLLSLLFFLYFIFYFLSTFKRATYKFDNRCDVLRAAFYDSRDVLRRGCITFLWRGCVIFSLESLHDFFVEKLHDFFWVDRLCDCVRRCWVIFSLTHSLRLHGLCFWRLRDFFCEGGAKLFFWRGCVIFSVESLYDFFVEKLHDFFGWTGCVIFFVERLRDYCV